MPEHTIAENLSRLITAKTDIANAITTMGGTVGQNDGFEDFPADIATIPSGGELGEYALMYDGTGSSGWNTGYRDYYLLPNERFGFYLYDQSSTSTVPCNMPNTAIINNGKIAMTGVYSLVRLPSPSYYSQGRKTYLYMIQAVSADNDHVVNKVRMTSANIISDAIIVDVDREIIVTEANVQTGQSSYSRAAIIAIPIKLNKEGSARYSSEQIKKFVLYGEFIENL